MVICAGLTVIELVLFHFILSAVHIPEVVNIGAPSHRGRADRDPKSVQKHIPKDEFVVVFFPNQNGNLDCTVDTKSPYHCPSGCSVRITTDKAEASTADALIWYSNHVEDGYAVPARSHPHQKYIIFLHQPLSQNLFLTSNRSWPELGGRTTASQFDWLLSYHKLSDILYTYSRGSAETFAPPPVNLSTRNLFAPVSWAARKCQDRPRIRFVEDFMRHVEVDSFGDCLHTRDWPTGMSYPMQYDHLANYKFYLALEAAVCEDYVSERYWLALERGSVPIVWAAPNFTEKFAPTRRSIIDVQDFDEDAGRVAQYVKYLHGNDTAYAEYLEWKTLPRNQLNPNFLQIIDYYDNPMFKPVKQTFPSWNTDGSWVCRLCEKLKLEYDVLQSEGVSPMKECLKRL